MLIVIETQRGVSHSTKSENTKSVGSFSENTLTKIEERNRRIVCPNRLSSVRKYAYPTTNFSVSLLVGYKISILGEVEVNTSGKINV